MTKKPLSALLTGDFVADMHDGLAPIQKRFAVVRHLRWREDLTAPRSLPFQFPNKHLRVLGRQDDGTVVCGYNYDGMMSGIVVLDEYVTGADARD